MRIHVSLDCPLSSDDSGPVRVGWLLNDLRSGIIYEPPRRVRSVGSKAESAKSASSCPAIIGLESRLFEVLSPFELKLEFMRDEDGIPFIRNASGATTSVKCIDQIIALAEEDAWRTPERPILQVLLPYVFVADDPVYMSQVAPYLHYRAESLPGIMLGGRFPINVWPRPLMWAFEWHDITRPLVLHRGEPMFYVQFETRPQDCAIQLVEARRTEQLSEYLQLISGAVNYVNQTFSLFKSAEQRRPAKLVEPVER
ncbi:MAG: hypothetical protein R3C53_16070 [Pirellulaceae bacterium]